MDKTVEWKPPNGGYGWVVVASALGGQCLSNYVVCTFGVYFLHWMEYFECDASVIGWVATTRMTGVMLTGLLAPGFIDRLGAQLVVMVSCVVAFLAYFMLALWPSIEMLFLTYGVLIGISATALYVASMASVQHYFTTKRSVAAGITMLGMCVGMFAFPPVVQYWIESFGWRGASFISSAIFLNGVPLGWLLKHTPLTRQKAVEARQQSFLVFLRHVVDFSVLRSISFCFFLLALLFVFFSHSTAVGYIPVHSVFCGYSEYMSALLVSLIGATGFLFRPGGGWVGDRPCIHPTFMFACAALGCGMSMLCFSMATQYYQFVVLCIMWSMCSSGYMAVLSTILVDILGVENIGKGTGMFMTMMGLGSLVAQVVAGNIVDLTGHTQLLFVTLGASQVIGSIFTYITYCTQKRRDSSTEKNNKCIVDETVCPEPKPLAAVVPQHLTDSNIWGSTNSIPM